MDVEELDEKLKWNSLPDLHFSKSDFKKFGKSFKSSNTIKDMFEFEFEPMQIRTFRFWTY